MPNKLRPFRIRTVLEIAEETAISVGDGIFLQSFVLRHFSIVQESEAREPHLYDEFFVRFESLSEERESA